MESQRSEVKPKDRVERIALWLSRKQTQVETLGKFTIVIDVAGLSIRGHIVPAKEQIE